MEDNRKNKILVIIIMILIIILLLLLLNKCEKKDDNYYSIPTGNVDVFDIDIKCNNDNNCEIKNNDTDKKEEIKQNNINNDKILEKNDNDINSNKVTVTNNSDNNNTNNKNIEKSNSNYNSDNKLPVFNEETDKGIIGTVFVEDSSGNYVYQQNLNIFNNAAYEYTNKIAPGVSNTYLFKVHNSSNVQLKYYVEMYEESEYKINLKYRLKKNNSYVIGDDSTWVTADELKTSFTKINVNAYDEYALEWKWFDSDEEDTIAGENMTSEYKLNIRFYFEEVVD